MGIPASINQAPPADDQANAVISGQFAAIGTSSEFMVWGPFNLSIWGNDGPNGDWNGTVRVERSFDGGDTWLVLCSGAAATQLIFATANQDVSLTLGEPEKGILYRLNCTVFTSGPINYRLSATGQAALALAVASAI